MKEEEEEKMMMMWSLFGVRRSGRRVSSTRRNGKVHLLVPSRVSWGAGRGRAPSNTSGDWQDAGLAGREKAYADVVAKMNDPNLINEEFDPVKAFLAAASSVPDGARTSQQMWREEVWILSLFVIGRRLSVSIPSVKRGHINLLGGSTSHMDVLLPQCALSAENRDT